MLSKCSLCLWEKCDYLISWCNLLWVHLIWNFWVSWIQISISISGFVMFSAIISWNNFSAPFCLLLHLVRNIVSFCDFHILVLLVVSQNSLRLSKYFFNYILFLFSLHNFKWPAFKFIDIYFFSSTLSSLKSNSS